MTEFFRTRSQSLSMVVFVLLVIVFLQGSISYSTTFGALSRFIPGMENSPVAGGWLALRLILIMVVLLLWLLTRKRHLFRAIIITNGLLTLGLFINMSALLDSLSRLSSQAVKSLIVDVVLMAVTNILIFSIWYWIIDPPGIDETQRVDVPWDFLFPQRGASLPHYESWVPRYTDYLYRGLYHQLRVQSDRYAAPHPPRQDADAIAVCHLDHHPDRDCRQRDQSPGGRAAERVGAKSYVVLLRLACRQFFDWFAQREKD